MAKTTRQPRARQADKDIGQRILLRRVELGMSQQTLASALGVTFQQIQKYENGINRVNAPRLQQIAISLRVPFSFFYDGSKSSDEQQEVESLLALDAALGLRLLRVYKAINSPQLRRSCRRFHTSVRMEKPIINVADGKGVPWNEMISRLLGRVFVRMDLTYALIIKPKCAGFHSGVR